MKHLVAAAIVAVGSTTALAAPAFADPDTAGSKVDQSFTKAISNSGLSIAPKDAIALAHSTCDLVERGGTVNDALRHLKRRNRMDVDGRLQDIRQPRRARVLPQRDTPVAVDCRASPPRPVMGEVCAVRSRVQ